EVLAMMDLGKTFAAVTGRLPATEAARPAAKAAKKLLFRMRHFANPLGLSYLSLGLAAVAGRLPPDEASPQAAEAADLLVAALAKDIDLVPLQALVEGLAATAPRMMPPRQAGERLVSAMGKTDFLLGPPVLADALREWAVRQTTIDLVAVLRGPLAAGRVQHI